MTAVAALSAHEQAAFRRFLSRGWAVFSERNTDAPGAYAAWCATTGQPMVATPAFIADYAWAWGNPPWCHGCRHPIRPGEPVRWGEAGRRATLVHERCAEKADRTAVARGGRDSALTGKREAA